MSKSTKQLQEELTSAPDLGLFLRENESSFQNVQFSDRIQEMFVKSGLSKSALAKRAGTSDVYLYQIFSGARIPSRDKTLCLCFGLSASLEETQELLKQCGFAPLYIKNHRDAIILYCLSNGENLETVNDRLFSEKENTLC